MLKQEKLDFQAELEEYMETNEVYQHLEGLMRNLIIDMPADPVKYLLEKCEAGRSASRVIIMGPPGSKRKEHALDLAEHFKFETISVGDLLQKEIHKKSDLGKCIKQSKQASQYVDDDIAIELVKKQLQAFEKEGKSWIIEGFPRTRKQALALVKMNFIPDKFILLDEKETEATRERIVDKMKDEEGKEIDYADACDRADKQIEEYNYHIEGVLEVYKGGNLVKVDNSHS